ncbi:TPA: CHAP domain-containing protein [Enterococcus faecalis]|nr:CHAP domain-containing protein [Enterococcus faecium]HEM7700328.1 CHAP domain-containing protein [Enterococcus faecalis]HEM7730202.1 CHAP domain-containing protein [Enterococcus faecalis]
MAAKQSDKFTFKTNEKLTKNLYQSTRKAGFRKNYRLEKGKTYPTKFRRFKHTQGFINVRRVSARSNSFSSSSPLLKKYRPKKSQKKQSNQGLFYKSGKGLKKVASTVDPLMEQSSSEDEEEQATNAFKQLLKKPTKKMIYLSKQGIQEKFLKKNGFTNHRGMKKYVRPIPESKQPSYSFKNRPFPKMKPLSKAKVYTEKAVTSTVTLAKSVVSTTISFVSTFSFPLIGIVGTGILLILFLSLFVSIKDNQCSRPSYSGITTENLSKTPRSIDDFIKSHKDAYILSWKAGGFLPSASIAQTMVENGFNFTNPLGTSFWQAHNMGGVKTSRLEDFPITLATFGKDAVDITGTKPGTNVGDNTGGAYTYFKDYNAGIVGKAEFMAHQTLYKGAINNTDGIATLKAIANGGWATDPSYLIHLLSAYRSLGQNYQWIDREAIEKHGIAPYKRTAQTINSKDQRFSQSSSVENGCVVNQMPSKEATGTNSAPTLSLPKAYVGKLTLPPPDNKNYAGNNYPFGQCTWGAYNRMSQLGTPIEWFSGDGGNGGSWGASARARGYTVVKGKPQVGWAASFYGGLAGSTPPYGHIAVCEYVNPDGSILVSETNVVNPGSGTRSWRVIDPATVAQVEFIQGRK